MDSTKPPRRRDPEARSQLATADTQNERVDLPTRWIPRTTARVRILDTLRDQQLEHLASDESGYFSLAVRERAEMLLARRAGLERGREEVPSQPSGRLWARIAIFSILLICLALTVAFLA